MVWHGMRLRQREQEGDHEGGRPPSGGSAGTVSVRTMTPGKPTAEVGLRRRVPPVEAVGRPVHRPGAPGPVSPTRSAPDPGLFALAVDLGTSGLKVGLVSLAGTIAWHEHTPLSTRVDGDAATQDATSWWALVRDSARRALALGGRPA